MGVKSRGNFSTNMEKCMPNCRCIFCKRERANIKQEALTEKENKMKVFNKKGIVWAATPGGLFIITAISMIGAAVLLTPSHRINKAVERCVEVEGISEADCVEVVDGMSEDEVLDYIKDKASSDDVGNLIS